MKRDTRYYQQHGLLRIFLSYFGPHRRLFLLDMLCALFIGAVDLIFPLISRRAINTMLPAHAYHTFFVVMGIMAAAYLVRAFFYYIIAYYGTRSASASRPISAATCSATCRASAMSSMTTTARASS